MPPDGAFLKPLLDHHMHDPVKPPQNRCVVQSRLQNRCVVQWQVCCQNASLGLFQKNACARMPTKTNAWLAHTISETPGWCTDPEKRLAGAHDF